MEKAGIPGDGCGAPAGWELTALPVPVLPGVGQEELAMGEPTDLMEALEGTV